MTPEGAAGRRGILAFAAACLFFFYAFLLRVAPSVMVDGLMRDFDAGGALFGHLSAVYFYAYATMQLPVGLLLDRFGAKRLLTLAPLLAALGSLVFAVAGSTFTASVGRFLVGFGSAFSWIGLLVVAGHYFPARRFPLLAGIGQLVGLLGSLTGQAPLGVLVTAIGWRQASAATAVLGLLLAVALWLVAPAGERRPAGRSLLQGLRSVTARRQSWLYGICGFTLTSSLLAFSGLWAVPFLAMRYGLALPAAGALASSYSVGWALGAPGWGALAPRLGARRILVVAGAAATATSAAIVWLPGVPVAAMAALCFALGVAGSAMTVTFGGVRECNDPRDSGAALGLTNTCVMMSGALLQPLIGLVLDWRWEGATVAGARVYGEAAYETALAVLPAAAALGTLAAALLPKAQSIRPQSIRR